MLCVQAFTATAPSSIRYFDRLLLSDLRAGTRHATVRKYAIIFTVSPTFLLLFGGRNSSLAPVIGQIA